MDDAESFEYGEDFKKDFAREGLLHPVDVAPDSEGCDIKLVHIGGVEDDGRDHLHCEPRGESRYLPRRAGFRQGWGCVQHTTSDCIKNARARREDTFDDHFATAEERVISEPARGWEELKSRLD